MNLQLFLITFILFIILRSIFYYSKFRRTKKFKSIYLDYFDKRDFEFLQHKPQILSLFQEAKVQDFSFFHTEDVGYGNLARTELSGFDNIAFLRKDITIIFRGKFEEAIGYYYFNFRQSFSLIFWIEFVLKFPEKFFSFIQIKLPNSILKIIQILFWSAGLFTFLDKFKLIDATSFF